MEVLKRRKRVTEPEVRYFGIQLLSALNYLHVNKILHRDLKLGNLFLDHNMQIKLGDFGLATSLDSIEDRKCTICGTPNYIAPEVLGGSHSYEADLWSFGVILYTMLVGTPPFETKDVKTTYKRIKSNIYSFPPHCPVSEEAQDLVRSILHPTPSKRPSINQICWHPFFVKATNQVPRVVPSSAMREEPSIHSLDYEPGHQAVRKMLEEPVGGLRVEIKHAAPQSSKPVPPPAVPEADEESSGTPKETKNPESFGAKCNDLASKDDKSSSSSGYERGGSRPYSGNKYSSKHVASAIDGTAAPTEERLSSLSKGQEKISRQPLANRYQSNHAHNNVGVPLKDKFSSLNKQQELASRQYSTNRYPSQPVYNDVVAPKEEKAVSSYEQERATLPSSTNRYAPKATTEESKHDRPAVWVSAWLDYSEKYGMAYLLSNGSVGVFFNDTTKIILASNGENFEYVERASSKQDSEGHNQKDKRTPQRQRYTMTDYPQDLKKKVTLLRHFKGFLFEEQRKKESVSEEETACLAAGSNTEDMPFVKKWVRTRHAILFRLSNRTVQVNFKDKTSIVLSAEAPLITYLDQSGNRTHHVLATILNEGRPDISRRLRYTKDILHQLIVGTSKTPSSSAHGAHGSASASTSPTATTPYILHQLIVGETGHGSSSATSASTPHETAK